MLHLTAFFLFTIVLTIECTLPACATCPTKGVWSQWQDYTTCSATCGLFGTKVQSRTCTSWAKGCACVGPSSRAIPCAANACPLAPFCKTGYTKYVSAGKPLCGNATNSNDYVAPTCTLTKIYDTCPCPAGGLWSAWVNSGTCSATCGLCGTVAQTRTCRSTSFGCPCTGASTRTLACPKTRCTKGTNVPCCKGYPLVNATATGAPQCGVQLAPDPVLALPPCPTTTTTTTTTATTTRAANSCGGIDTTTTKGTTTSTTTTTLPPCSCSANPNFNAYPPANPPTPPPAGVAHVCTPTAHQWGCAGEPTAAITFLLVDYAGEIARNVTFCGRDWAVNLINGDCDTGFPAGSSTNYASWEGSQISYFVCAFNYAATECGATTTTQTTG